MVLHTSENTKRFSICNDKYNVCNVDKNVEIASFVSAYISSTLMYLCAKLDFRFDGIIIYDFYPGLSKTMKHRSMHTGII